MTTLEQLTQRFETSRPIFRLTVQSDGQRIDGNVVAPVYRYSPEPEEGNILDKLVCDMYDERFDTQEGRFVIDTFGIANRAMEKIRNDLALFVENNLDKKNPKQTKLYRFFRWEMPNTNEYNESMISLYKYLRSFSTPEMKTWNVQHKGNAIALMQAIMEKYG